MVHFPHNAVTGGTWRVRADPRSVVVRVLTDGRAPSARAAHWAAERDDPTHWNWWRREALVYAEDLPAAFRSDGVDAPALLGLDERDPGTVVLWLEDVEATPAAAWDDADFADAGRALGRAQGRLAVTGPPRHPWLSRGFLRRYSESKPVDPSFLDDEEAWARPLVAEHLGPLREGLRALHEQRHRLFAIAERCPRTLCHLNVWPSNLLRRAGDERLARLGVHASAVKYHWLAERLVRGDHERAVVYGGRVVPAHELHRARAAGPRLLLDWADAARSTADGLGWA